MTSYLTTLGACRRYFATTRIDPQASTATEDAIIADLIPIASQIIEDYCGNSFAPVLETRDFDVKLGANELHFKGNLPFSVLSVMDPNGTVLDPSLYQVAPPSRSPKRSILLAPGNYWTYSGNRAVYDNPSGFSSFTYGTSGTGAFQSHIADAYLPSAVSVKAYWGYHRHYANAWLSSSATVASAVAATDSTLTLSIPAGQAALDVGSFIQIDGEFMVVLSPIPIALATVVGVARAQNGTTAAVHNVGAAISSWQPESVVEWSAREVTAALYKSRDNPSGDSVSVDGFGTVKLISHGLPQKTIDRLAEYRNYWSGH